MWVLGRTLDECVGEVKHHHFTVVYYPRRDVDEGEGGLLRGWSGTGVLTP